jgi:hypothetical protein
VCGGDDLVGTGRTAARPLHPNISPNSVSHNLKFVYFTYDNINVPNLGLLFLIHDSLELSTYEQDNEIPTTQASDHTIYFGEQEWW